MVFRCLQSRAFGEQNVVLLPSHQVKTHMGFGISKPKTARKFLPFNKQNFFVLAASRMPYRLKIFSLNVTFPFCLAFLAQNCPYTFTEKGINVNP